MLFDILYFPVKKELKTLKLWIYIKSNLNISFWVYVIVLTAPEMNTQKQELSFEAREISIVGRMLILYRTG